MYKQISMQYMIKRLALVMVVNYKGLQLLTYLLDDLCVDFFKDGWRAVLIKEGVYIATHWILKKITQNYMHLKQSIFSIKKKKWELTKTVQK